MFKALFCNKKRNVPYIDNLIAKGTTVTGDVSFSGGLRIDGEVLGNIFCADLKNGSLILSETACIKGSVKVSRLILNGDIHGPIEVSCYIELQSKARIYGDLSYKILEIHSGAIIEGRLVPLADSTVMTTLTADENEPLAVYG